MPDALSANSVHTICEFCGCDDDTCCDETTCRCEPEPDSITDQMRDTYLADVRALNDPGRAT